METFEATIAMLLPVACPAQIRVLCFQFQFVVYLLYDNFGSELGQPREASHICRPTVGNVRIGLEWSNCHNGFGAIPADWPVQTPLGNQWNRWRENAANSGKAATTRIGSDRREVGKIGRGWLSAWPARLRTQALEAGRLGIGRLPPK